MLTASQDIDDFIEGQRSKINQPSNRQEANYQQPAPAPPPPPPPPPPPNDSGDQSNVQVAQVLGETSPRMQTEQPFYSSSSIAPFASSSFMEQQDQQNFSNDDPNKNYYSFFDRFGTHDEVRARLNNDLKREYNEYLQSLQNMAKRKAASQVATSGGNTTRRVQFKQDRIFASPRQQTDRRAVHNTHSMNDISSTRTIHGTQSMNDLSTGRTMHNVQSMNDLSSTALTELASNRARARLVQQESEQYIRDREEYILELYQQIYELEARIRHLEKESHKLTLSNSTSSTRARYTEDLNALNALLVERLNQRVAVDHELAQILNRPPVALTTRGVVVNTVPSMSMPVIVPSTSMPVAASSMSMPIGQIFESSSPRTEQTTMKKRHQTGLETQIREVQTRKVTESQQQYQSPRQQQQQNPLIPGRPSTPTYGRGSLHNSIFGTFKTEEQVIRQEKYRQDLLQQIEEKRLRDAAELARRRAAEERERAKEYERQQLLERQMAEDALRKQQREEEERRQQQLLAEEQERLRRQEEFERQRREDELERQRRQDELERQRKQAELDRLKQLDEAERKRRQRQEELDRQKRKEEELERQRREELERQRREELERQRREELERQRREELERQRREESDLERQRREELERKRREEEEEFERKRREEEEEEERRRRTIKIGRSNSSLSFGGDGTESDLLRRLLQLKRQLKDKENQFKDTIKTDSTRYTHIVDYTLPPYIPPPQPFYLERRESSDDLLNIARIHYRDAPLTHDILLNILHTADGEQLNPSYTRDDSVIMRGIGDGKVFSDAEYLTLPKRVDEADDIFATNLGNAASRRRYGTSLQAFYDDDPLNTADKELNRIASKNDNRLKRLHHIEYADLDHDQLLERFIDKQQLERRGSQTIQLDNTTWLK